jgi:hypothetical protein
MYKFHGLASVEEDAFGPNHSSCSGHDLGHFLRHGPLFGCEVHVGQGMNHPSGDE